MNLPTFRRVPETRQLCVQSLLWSKLVPFMEESHVEEVRRVIGTHILSENESLFKELIAHLEVLDDFRAANDEKQMDLEKRIAEAEEKRRERMTKRKQMTLLSSSRTMDLLQSEIKLFASQLAKMRRQDIITPDDVKSLHTPREKKIFSTLVGVEEKSMMGGRAKSSLGRSRSIGGNSEEIGRGRGRGRGRGGAISDRSAMLLRRPESARRIRNGSAPSERIGGERDDFEMADALNAFDIDTVAGNI
eukprot:TRINITY_DN4037_c1_g2_i1.p1 TRINITY_DN4037_c1_g2~~TRINITY_DN4037_c1_g2_i1.p1  ORF type:complete len:268 (-),score=79.97 TRINITY_DN4037_c1_g2_i1:513-1253(-)